MSLTYDGVGYTLIFQCRDIFFIKGIFKGGSHELEKEIDSLDGCLHIMS